MQKYCFLLLFIFITTQIESIENQGFTMNCLREDVDPKDCWNIEQLYSSLNEWKQELSLLPSEKEKERFPDLASYRSRLDQGPDVLADLLDSLMDTSRLVEKLYTYIHLRHDEDITHDEHKLHYGRIFSTIAALEKETAWIQPEILSLPDSLLQTYLESAELSKYRFYLQKMIRLKPHTLSDKEEELLAMGGKALYACQNAFSALNDADLDFGTITDSNGNEHSLTHGSFSIFLRSPDQQFRKTAYQSLYEKYQQHSNTLAELLNGQVQKDLFEAKAHNYPTCLDAALYPKNIDTSVYHSLIEAVHKKLPILHKYNRLRKKALQLDELHMYDMYCPLVPNQEVEIAYEDAEKMVLESIAPLGKQYQDTLIHGLCTDRWVDRFENQNKRSGAYSSGCYDSMPYILMNYRGLLRDVFTLTHEAGHSMHSYFSRKAQPYHYANYPIFVAEVASTFNEELLHHYLLQQAHDPQMRAYLLNERIEAIRATLIRQAMFAEFELCIHKTVEDGQPLTPKILNDLYSELCKTYFGDDVIIDEYIATEWARIPHFYYNFYVYQYATGISAAITLAEKVLHGTEEDQKAYLHFLSSGSSSYPLDQLRLAGADLNTPEPVEKALDLFSSLVDQLEEALDVLATEPSKS